MKNTLSFYLVILLLSLTACIEDPCKSKVCENGICDTVSSNCNCADGYQQDAQGICTIEWTAKFLGTHSTTDSCVGAHPGTTIYNIAITATAPDKFDLSNLANKGELVHAVNTSSTNFSINDTTTNGLIFSGTGSLIDGDFVINYILNDSINGNGRDTCRAVLD